MKKKGIKDKKKKRIIMGSLAVAGFAFGCLVGAKYGAKKGEDQFIESLIHNYESGKNACPVYSSSDKKLGDLMYEIKAECIGD